MGYEKTTPRYHTRIVWVLQVEVGLLMSLLEEGMKVELNNFMK